MTHPTFPSLKRLFWGGVVSSCVAACSLQNFDYLKSGDGTGGAGTGGAGPGDAGAGEAATGGAGNETGGGTLVEDASNENAERAEGGPALDSGGRTDGGPSVLANPSFELGLSGWSFEPASAMGKYAYTQFPPGQATTIDGQNELATYSGNDAFTVRVFQIPSNLPSGKYTFTAYFNRGDGFNAAYLYSRNCGGPDRRQDIPLTAATQWLQVQIGAIDVTSSQCEVGFFVDSNPTDWLNADAFSFAEDPQ